MSSVEQCKEDIANKYLDQFKSELNFFEKAMILPITGKMKEILKSDKKIDAKKLSDLEDLGFRRKVLGVKFGNKELFESLVNKTFKFLKEQQERILEAQTQGKLDDLLNEAINGKLDNLDQTVDNSGGVQDGGNVQNQGQQDPLGTQGEQQQNPSVGSQGDQGKVQDQKGGRLNEHPVTAGLGTAAVSTGTYRVGIAEAERRMGLTPREIPENFDKEQTKKTFNELAKQMREKVEGKGVKLNRVQKYTYEKSIKNFEEAAKSLDNETADAFKIWQKIGDRLPPDYLKHLNINHGVLDMIDALPDDELLKLIGKDEKAIVKILGDKGINISEDFAKSLKLAGNVQELKQITNVARNGRKLASFLKGVKGMGVITFIFMGFDVWNYFDASKEAELVSKLNDVRGQVLQDEATAQLIIGLGGVAAEALGLFCVCAAGGSVGGPIGTAVGICIGVIVGAIAMIRSSYSEKKEFYSQNRHDFINKKRSEVKQSILQLFESDRLGMHEGMKSSIKDARGPNSEVNTMEDAWEALVYQEEIQNGGYEYLSWYYGSGQSEQEFLEKLSQEDKEEYQREKDRMEQVITVKMEYVKSYISDDHSSEGYIALKDAIRDKKGLAFVEQVLANSEIYSYLKSNDEDPYVENYKDLDISGYKETYKVKLSTEYAQEFAIFEKLREDNPLLLDEICRGTISSKSMILSYIGSETQNGTQEGGEQLYSQIEIETLKKNMDFIEKYDRYRKLGVTQEGDTSLGLSESSLDFNYIEQVLLDLNSISKRPKREKENSLKYITSSEFNTRVEEREIECSNSTFQNILYSIAKEIHGYTGKNDKQELVSYYASSGDVTGIYMNGKWKVNEDWEVDGTIESERKEMNQYGGYEITKGSPDLMTKEEMLKTIVGEVELDTAVEAADEKLTDEVRERIKQIINREFSYKEKKKEYEEKIVDYIKVQGEGGYVELPNHLVMEARKAGIGSVDNFLFSFENGKIVALGRGDKANRVLNFDRTNTKISYEVSVKLREEYTEEEKELIQKVDEIELKLSKMRGVEGGGIGGTKEDELDIPVEIERLMSKKSCEWQEIKESILYQLPITSHDYLVEKAKDYYEYFEGMYVGLLSEITRKNSFLNSNDIDEVEEFLQASSFVGVNIVSVEKGELKLAGAVDESIGKYLLQLFDLYKDDVSGKTVKQLLISEDAEEQKKGQELAKGLHLLCLEETVIETNSYGKIHDFTTGDMGDKVFEKVKDKMNEALSQKGFNEIYSKYQQSSFPSVGGLKSRIVEHGERDVHDRINKINEEIINTVNEVDWAHKRKNPKFEIDEKQEKEGEISGKFSSWGFKENVTVLLEGDDIVGLRIDGLDMVYGKDPSKTDSIIGIGKVPFDYSSEFIKDEIEEGLRTANLINFIKYNIKENPKGYGTYHWSNGGDLERDIIGDCINDVDIVLDDTIEKYYSSIKDDEDFIDYINSFL